VWAGMSGIPGMAASKLSAACSTGSLVWVTAVVCCCGTCQPIAAAVGAPQLRAGSQQSLSGAWQQGVLAMLHAAYAHLHSCISQALHVQAPCCRRGHHGGDHELQ
jgi:hypothetical protein